MDSRDEDSFLRGLSNTKSTYSHKNYSNYHSTDDATAPGFIVDEHKSKLTLT